MHGHRSYTERCCDNGSFSLPRQQRLVKPRFRAAFDGGRSHASRCMVMWLRPTDGELGQVGFVATKRIFPRAVDRNRVRRLLREAYRLNQHHLPPKVDIILLARKPIIVASGSEVAAAFRSLCQRVRLWSDAPC